MQANYPAGSPHAPCSGAEAYRRYQTAFVETVGDVSRAEVVWEGKIDRTFIGDASQDWDKCLLVRYPSRQHFLAMMANAAYREALVHRCAGLERTILAARHALYLKARERNPARWSGTTRDWTATGPDTLNPERDSVIAAQSTAPTGDWQPLAA